MKHLTPPLLTPFLPVVPCCSVASAAASSTLWDLLFIVVLSCSQLKPTVKNAIKRVQSQMVNGQKCDQARAEPSLLELCRAWAFYLMVNGQWSMVNAQWSMVLPPSFPHFFTPILTFPFPLFPSSPTWFITLLRRDLRLLVYPFTRLSILPF